MPSSRLSWLLPLLVLAFQGSTQAEDPPPRSSASMDLAPWKLAAAAQGAVLLAPSDRSLEGQIEEWSTAESSGEPGGARPTWVTFDVGAEEEQLDASTLVETLRLLAGLEHAEVDLQAAGERLWVRGTPQEIERVRARLAWAQATFLPRCEVRALLTSGPDQAVVASARARLLPGRWARVWLQESRPVFPVDWDIEIAQETTAMVPLLVPLQEGQELYLRWLPGEGADLLEVWHGDLEHQEETTLDLTPVRNVPESSGPGPVRVPRTALRRAYTVLRLPAEGPTRLAWRSPEGERRLLLERVAQDAPPPSQAHEDFRTVVLRTGALAAPLLFEGRGDGAELLQAELYRAAEPDLEIEMRDVGGTGRTLTTLGAKAGVEAELRRRLVTAEAELESATLRLRTLVVPEEAVREALGTGRLGVGGVLEAALATTLARTGALDGHAIELPLLAGVEAGVRAGSCVLGLRRLDVEVAQQAGGMDPVMGARFAGLQGEALWRREGAGATLRLQVLLAWAEGQGGRVDLTFRAPVGMDFNKDRVQAEPDAVRRVTLPTLRGGSSEIDVELAIDSSTERVAGVSVRDGEVVLLLVSLAR